MPLKSGIEFGNYKGAVVLALAARASSATFLANGAASC